MHGQEEAEKPVVKKVYGYSDLMEFQDPNLYSSIGKMKLSHKPTAPQYGFGTADRKKQAKIFQSKELCKTQFVGMNRFPSNFWLKYLPRYNFSWTQLRSQTH